MPTKKGRDREGKEELMANENKDPRQILGELTKNPEALRSMMGAITAAQDGAQNNAAENTSPAPLGTPPIPDISAMLSDPQTLAKISGVMSMLKSSVTGAQGAPESKAAAQQGSVSPTPDKSAALLLALKPYLSADRQAAIENLIKFSKVGEILKNM